MYVSDGWGMGTDVPAYAAGRRETRRWGRRRGRRTSDVALWRGVLASVILLVLARQAYAARPLAVDDAAPLEWGHVKVELATALNTSEDVYGLIAPFNLALGLTPWLEVGMSPSVLYVNNPEASPRRVGLLMFFAGATRTAEAVNGPPAYPGLISLPLVLTCPGLTFPVDLPAGMTLVLDTDANVYFNSVDTVVTVITPSGTILGSDDDDGFSVDSSLLVRTTVAGTHTIAIVGFGGSCGPTQAFILNVFAR